MSGSGGSISSSSSEGRAGGESSREGSRRSVRMMKSSDASLGDAPDEEDESWSSDYSASDEEDPETFSESTEVTIFSLVHLLTFQVKSALCSISIPCQGHRWCHKTQPYESSGEPVGC